MIDRKLLEILVCPKCKNNVILDEPSLYLVCGYCGLKYPIKDDIPVMLIDEAEKI